MAEPLTRPHHTNFSWFRDQDDDTAHLADKDGRVPESRTASCCLNLWLILFLFLLVVAVGAGYFANEETDNGIKVTELFLAYFPFRSIAYVGITMNESVSISDI